MNEHSRWTFGAVISEGGVRFRYPALREAIEVEIEERGHFVRRALARRERAFEASFHDLGAGTRYRLVIDGERCGDPFARWLPEGPLGPAEVLAAPRSAAPRVPLELTRPRSFYELHVGTFTREGTYRAASERIGHLADLGIDAIELMPLATFAGARGWGYDGVAWLAPHPSYGTPQELVDFVDAAHRAGLSVIVDVVLNHFGPEGNWLAALGPDLFDRESSTPWGAAPDYRDPVMRGLAREVLRTWIEDYRIDGVRLDATHAIIQPGVPHMLEELASYARTLAGPPLLIAEDDRNEPSLLSDVGIDGLWADDLHHALHVLLTGERDGYYAAYEPTLETVARAIARGWIYEGQPYPTTGAPRGAPLPPDLPRSRLIVGLSNHDQIGNRARGEHLGHLISCDALCGAIVAVAFLPCSLLLFQGAEWSASTPFLFFSDLPAELGRAVTEGRRREFASFVAFASEAERASIPDPQAYATFAASVLDWSERDRGDHARVLDLWRRALRLRRQDSVLSGALAPPSVRIDGGVLHVDRVLATEARCLQWNLGPTPIEPEQTGARLLLRSRGRGDEPLAPGEAMILASA